MDQTDTGVIAESVPKKTPNFSKEKPPFLGLYREDVVKSATRPGVLGIITKVAGDSDSESSSDGEEEEDDDGDDDDDESTESLSEGCAQVFWMNSEENAESFDDIQVVDRSFVHGDIVALVASPSGQTGTVVNVDLLVDLELPDGETLTDVDSRSLKHIQPFSPGDYVIRDHWLGRVDEVVDNVTVMFNDGSKCKVMRADPMRLIPLPEGSMMDDSGCPYYPGQRVKASSSTLFKSAKWLRGSWKPSRIEGVVTEIEVGSVVVYWIVAAHAKAGVQPSAIPLEQQDPKDLKVMTYLSYTNWNLGDHALLSKKYRWKEGENTTCVADVNQKGEEASASESALVAKDGQPTESGWTPHRKKLRPRIGKHEKRPKRKGGAGVERASLVVNTRTKVDVVWQDGTCERGIGACSLFPIDHLGDHEFWPGQYVQEQGPEIEGFGSETQRVGVVKTVDSKQRTAVVKWLRQLEGSDEERKFEKEEVVSVYELVEHPDYSYSLGDVVIRLCSSLDVSETLNTSEALNTSEPDDSETLPPSGVADNPENGDETKQLSSTESKASGESKRGKSKTKMQNSDLSWVGFIIGLEDGDIEVAWGNGSVSKVGPQAVFVVGRDEGDESTQSSDIGDIEDVDDAGSWETVDPSDASDQETGELDQFDWNEAGGGSRESAADQSSDLANTNSCEPKEYKGTNRQGGPVLENSVHKLGGVLSLPLAALFRVLQFAAGLLWRLRGPGRIQRSREAISSNETLGILNQPEATNGGEEEPKRTQQELSGLSISEAQEEASKDVSITAVHNEGNGAIEIDDAKIASSAGENEDNNSDVGENDDIESNEGAVLKDQTDIPLSHYPYGFKHFDCVKDPADHHFLNEAIQPSNQRKWSKKVQQEWGILEKNLPDTIYVRVYEDRMELLRSVIVGAAGTPYQDGLFVFDICFPPEYPTVPPLVHYHSGGLRLNPNLYETGKVCLSLINTWTGKGTEVWHPLSSSILQVLVSIQGLVLNTKPYFNEAGYDKQLGTVEGEKNSLAYSENSFLLSCKTMLYLLRRPPKDLEGLVQEHFKHRGPFILRACNAYMQGAPVGYLRDDATLPSDVGSDNTSSVGFRLILAKLIPKLHEAFTQIGADCQHLAPEENPK